MNNDLISRSALKKALKEKFDDFIPEGVYDEIDNAPAVEYPFYQEAYQTGYEEGKNEMTQDLINKVNVNIGLAQPIKDERPQGDPTGDLIRREDLIKEIGKLSLAWEYGQGVKDCIDIIENVRSFYLPFCIKVNNVTDEDIQAIKDIMEDYRPQVLRLEDDRSNGTWINRGIVRECPECHCYCFLSIDDKIEGGKLKFCPNCGADMRGEDNG